jgi:transglutaminase-like putative cysteine protease
MASVITAPALPLPADRFYRTALFFLVLTSTLAIVTTGKLDPVTTTLAASAVIYKGFRWWRGYPAELRQTLATRMVVAYLFFFPVDIIFVSRNFMGTAANSTLFSALLASVHFLLFVTIVRLYSAVTDRDALFLAMLAFAGILASAVFTIDTYFLAFFLIFLLSAVAVFLGLEIRRGASQAIFPPVAARSDRERRFHRALSLAALTVAAGAVLFGSILFFVFPRFSAGYFAHSNSQPSFMSGFSDNVELGQIGEIKKSSAVVMRVRTGSPVNYPLLRWRGIAMTTFDGHRWSADDPRQRNISRPVREGWIPLVDPTELEGRPAVEIHFTVWLEPTGSEVIFAPFRPIALRGNFSAEGGNYDGEVRHSYLAHDSSASIFNPAHKYAAIRYDGISVLPVARPMDARNAGTNYPTDIRDTYLQLPAPLDPRISQLARQITASANSPLDKSIKLESYLRSNFAYTLNLTGKPGKDPLAHFLFDVKAGHCEYFASAMAVMLRTLKIPARVVNGFLPGEYNDVAGDYIVHASDAHSWVEAYFPGFGWLVFDPTPPANDSSLSLLSRLGMYIDWFQLNWNEWVINYDFTHQLVLAQNVRRNSADWTEALRTKFRNLEAHLMGKLTTWQGSHNNLRVVFPAALVLLLFILRFDWIRKFFLWLALQWQVNSAAAAGNNPQLASRLYSELLRLLEKRGYSRPSTQTPREFAASSRLQAELVPAITEFTELYARARFGGKPCDSLRLRSLLDQVRSAPRSR